MNILLQRWNSHFKNNFIALIFNFSLKSRFFVKYLYLFCLDWRWKQHNYHHFSILFHWKMLISIISCLSSPQISESERKSISFLSNLYKSWKKTQNIAASSVPFHKYPRVSNLWACKLQTKALKISEEKIWFICVKNSNILINWSSYPSKSNLTLKKKKKTQTK